MVERTLGFVFDATRILPLLVSLSEAAITEERQKLLLDACRETCINYPGASLEFFQNHNAKNSVEEAMLKAIQVRHDEYFLPREHRDELREFRPSSQRFQRFMAFQQRNQAEVQKRIDDSGEFVFSKLMTRVALIRGNTWISHIPARGSESADELRLTPPSDLKTFSHELEASRLHMIDPDGSDHLVRVRRQQVKRGTGD